MIEYALEEIVNHLETLEAKFGTKPVVEKRNKKDEDDNYDEDGETKNKSNNKKEEGEKTQFSSNKQYNKHLQMQSLNARLDVIHSEVWPVDFKYSLRRRADTLETEGMIFIPLSSLLLFTIKMVQE